MMAATARMMSAYVVDMRWGASLSPSAALDLRKAEVCHRGHESPRCMAPFSITSRPDATPGTVMSASSECAPDPID